MPKSPETGQAFTPPKGLRMEMQEPDPVSPSGGTLPSLPKRRVSEAERQAALRNSPLRTRIIVPDGESEQEPSAPSARDAQSSVVPSSPRPHSQPMRTPTASVDEDPEGSAQPPPETGNATVAAPLQPAVPGSEEALSIRLGQTTERGNAPEDASAGRNTTQPMPTFISGRTRPGTYRDAQSRFVHTETRQFNTKVMPHVFDRINYLCRYLRLNKQDLAEEMVRHYWEVAGPKDIPFDPDEKDS